MLRPNPIRCACGHGASLHDRHGCAAFLGAFPETMHERRYCTCDVRSLVPFAVGEPAERTVFVARVRLATRRGSAIAVCEFPAALELGASPEDVLGRLKARLRVLIPPAVDGGPQHIAVVSGRAPLARAYSELLR
jgi:hypothetical protein